MRRRDILAKLATQPPFLLLQAPYLMLQGVEPARPVAIYAGIHEPDALQQSEICHSVAGLIAYRATVVSST